jgi:hydroxyacylglutathione hydrolase
MIHIVMPLGPLQCNCSILGDEKSHQCIVVDPGAEIEEIEQVLTEKKLKVTHIVITHAHIDHIGGAMKLRATTGAPILMNEADLEQFPMLEMQAKWVGMESPGKVILDQSLHDHEKFIFGGTEAIVLHTPGHTSGSSCLYLPTEKKLIAGDTLFAGSIGRTDLPGGDMDAIMRSLQGPILALPDDTIVFPGHGPVTTIGEERQSNPFLSDDQYKPRIQS